MFLFHKFIPIYKLTQIFKQILKNETNLLKVLNCTVI